jgi:hypothetical protein
MLEKNPYEFLKDGDLVLVNGSGGYIEIIKQDIEIIKQETNEIENNK